MTKIEDGLCILNYFQREIQLSDFARPPKKPPRAGKGTFGQTNGLHPLVERRIWNTSTIIRRCNGKLENVCANNLC